MGKRVEMSAEAEMLYQKMREDEADHGSCFITREKDGTITIRVRSPGTREESRINLPAHFVIRALETRHE